MPGHSSDKSPEIRLGVFLRTYKGSILADWTRRIRELPPARTLSRARLIDHLPELLERIATIADSLEAGEGPPLSDREADQHANARLYEGFDLSEVVAEFTLLRDCIARMRDELAHRPKQASFRWLHQAIDHAITASVDRYVEARDRVLKAVDRVSSAALESRRLDELLRNLLAVFVEMLPAAATAVILLREGNHLRLHASIGMEGEVGGTVVRVGEGFAGTIATTGRPLLVGESATEPHLEREGIRRTGLRALYGVPMRDGGEAIGVAHMGSLTSHDFSEQDKRLFEAMTERATSAVFYHQLREAAERRAAELDAVIEAIPDALIISDTSGNLKYNRAALTLTDLVAEDLPSQDPTSMPPEATLLGRALKGESSQTEISYRDIRSDRRVLMHTVAAPIQLHGRTIGAVTLGTDVTERKRVEKELEDAAYFRERFIAILGHDLRNPLNAIRMGATIVRQQAEVSQSIRATIARIERSAERMERMIDDVVDFARGRLGGGIPIQREPTRLRDVASAVMEELTAVHGDRRLALVAPSASPGEWDPVRLGQLMSNLVANALQHGKQDAPVTIRIIDDGPDVVIEVHNEGSPIPAEIMPHLFDAFRRRVESPRHEGLGLGLFIVKAIVDAHRGSIEVRSTAEEGTTFTVRLPRFEMGIGDDSERPSV